VKVAHCENVECTVATISTIGATDTGFPWPVSLAIGADGFGYIEFSNTLAAHCLNAACTEASVGIKGEDITYLDPDADAVDLVTTRFITGEDGQRYRVRFRNYREVGYATDWSRPRFEAFLCDDANCTSATLLFDEWFGELGTARIVSWQAQIGLDGTWLLAYSQRPLGASGPISLKTFHCDALDRCRP